jgi:nucleoside recognition membrane protein YjiH
MVNHSNQPAVTTVQLSWQAIFWRLLITLLLLLALAGPGLTIFSAVTAKPDAQILPTFARDIEPGK